MTDTSVSSIVTTLGGGSGIDMSALATNLATGQFPATGQLRRTDALCHQDLGVANQGARDDDLGRHGQ